jgi:hypothetical protein
MVSMEVPRHGSAQVAAQQGLQEVLLVQIVHKALALKVFPLFRSAQVVDDQDLVDAHGIKF